MSRSVQRLSFGPAWVTSARASRSPGWRSPRASLGHIRTDLVPGGLAASTRERWSRKIGRLAIRGAVSGLRRGSRDLLSVWRAAEPTAAGRRGARAFSVPPGSAASPPIIASLHLSAVRPTRLSGPLLSRARASVGSWAADDSLTRGGLPFWRRRALAVAIGALGGAARDPQPLASAASRSGATLGKVRDVSGWRALVSVPLGRLRAGNRLAERSWVGVSHARGSAPASPLRTASGARLRGSRPNTRLQTDAGRLPYAGRAQNPRG